MIKRKRAGEDPLTDEELAEEVLDGIDPKNVQQSVLRRQRPVKSAQSPKPTPR